MELSYEEAFDVACKLLGRALVREEVLTGQVELLSKALATEAVNTATERTTEAAAAATANDEPAVDNPPGDAT